jgi:hypothetical protein
MIGRGVNKNFLIKTNKDNRKILIVADWAGTGFFLSRHKSLVPAASGSLATSSTRGGGAFGVATTVSAKCERATRQEQRGNRVGIQGGQSGASHASSRLHHVSRTSGTAHKRAPLPALGFGLELWPIEPSGLLRPRRWQAPGSCELSETHGASSVHETGAVVDFHLEHGLRLLTEPEHKSLYSWAISEIDAQGQQIGRDQIPWDWTLRFTAASCVLGENIEIKSQSRIEKTPLPLNEVAQHEVIRVRLRPGGPQDDDDYLRQTTFSMFGTDRVIKSFQLDIHPIANPAEQESCSAWGTVSCTTEIDFRNETTDDCIVFYLFVKPDTFARYAAKIADGSVDEMILSVGSVAGFYSEWSPSISTRQVKVLTKGGEQNVTLPAGLPFEPPRLGDVGTAELYINRRLEFAQQAPEPEDGEKIEDFGTKRVIPETQAPTPVDPQIFQMLGSLRRAAWFVVCLLALILIVTILKH